MVIGLNHRTAPLAMRERFWLPERRRYETLQRLKSAEGVEEVVVLCTRCRSEYLIWASEPTVAANSLLQFLGSEHGLKLSEWQHFYRLLDETALTHIFRVAAGLDSLFLGEPQVVSQVDAAWQQARTVGAAGPFLNAIIEKALRVSGRVRNETAIGKLSVSIPSAALELSRQTFGTLAGRRLLLLGTDEMCELSVRYMMGRGAASVVVIDQSPSRAREMAEKLGGTASTISDRWKCMLDADIVISSSGCPHIVLTRDEAERIAQERNRVALVIIDIGMPRDIDPAVRRVDGIMLYDLEGLEHAVHDDTAEGAAASAEAEKIVAAEARTVRSQLQSTSTVPTCVALHGRLGEICRHELKSFIEERGPFTREQDQALHAVTNQVIQKIASFLARELKQLPERAEQEQMTAAVNRLFHLDSPVTALAGSESEKPRHEHKGNVIAVNY